MIRILAFFFLSISTFLNNSIDAHPAAKRLKYGPDWDYQPILINGEEVLRSINASGGSQIIYKRYEAIKQLLNHYDRPFTVLDIGANNGFFSLKIAEDFDAVCVLVDVSERLTDICTLNTERDKIIHLRKRFLKQDLWELTRREHFDVILALHVLHHVDDWRSWLSALLTLGDNVIIETPAVDDPINTFEHTKQLARYVTGLSNAIEIGSFPRGNSYDHMLWFCQNPRTFMERGNKLGISSRTFFDFGGAFPTRSYVQDLNTQIHQRHKTDKWLLQGIDYILE